MNWMILLDRILKKPPLFVIVPIITLFVLLLGHFRLSFPFDALWFFLGGVIGMYLLDAAEVVFNVKPSPFRSIVFAVSLAIVTFYITTSTREFIAKGLCLSLSLTLALQIITEWRAKKNIQEWFSLMLGQVSEQTQKTTVVVVCAVVLLLHCLFIVS